MFTEAIAEAKDKRQPLYAAALDTMKAFDTVWHESLLRKLYIRGMDKHWSIRSKMIQNMVIRIRVGDELSRSVIIQQGVGQGRPWSSHDYKVMIDDILHRITETGIGITIGPYTCSSPTCADDMLLLANSPDDLQMLLDIVLAYSQDEHYTIHPTKSMITVFGRKPSHEISWTLGETMIPTVDSCKHLGIERITQDRSNSTIIKQCISTARRASYALMGAGFHGNNGSSPMVIRQLYLLYVVPRCIYGLETLIFKKSHLEALERYHRKTLKQLLSLPDRTANEAVYLLAGIPPITALLHMKTLNLMGAIARSPDSMLHQIGQRQLAVKDTTSHSWFTHMCSIAELYDLPSPHQLYVTPPSKLQWKHLVQQQVLRHYEMILQQSATSKSTLKFLNTDCLSLKKPSIFISSVEDTETDVMRTRVHLRFITGTYMLQYNRARFNNYTVDATCLLCGTEKEDILHVISRCPAYQRSRQRFHDELRDANLLPPGATSPRITSLLALDPAQCSHDPHLYQTSDRSQLFHLSRKYLYAVHSARNHYININSK